MSLSTQITAFVASALAFVSAALALVVYERRRSNADSDAERAPKRSPERGDG